MNRFMKFLAYVLSIAFIFGFFSGASSGASAGSLRRIPILAYHCIDNNIFGQENLFVTPAEFERQMSYLRKSGYTPVTFRDIDDPDRIEKIAKPVLITFDDGYEDNYLNAYPVLQKYRFKATIFLISGFIGKPHHLSAPEIIKMTDLVDFEDHTRTHPRLSKLASPMIADEFSESARAIESLTHRKVIAVAYPFGDHDQKVKKIAARHFKYAVTTDFGMFYGRPESCMNIRRISILRTTSMNSFKRLLDHAGDRC